MREISDMVVHAAWKALSVVGRHARMSYAAAMEGRRWLVAGSETRIVARRRVVGSLVEGTLFVEGEGWWR